jgi:hypothetical protein
MEHDEAELRGRAYEIWEAKGRPEGEHLSHWQQALAELGLASPVEPSEEDTVREPLEDTTDKRTVIPPVTPI